MNLRELILAAEARGFLIELGFLDGRARLAGRDVQALLRDDAE